MQAEHERTAGLSGLEGGEAKPTGFDGDLADRLGGHLGVAVSRPNSQKLAQQPVVVLRGLLERLVADRRAAPTRRAPGMRPAQVDG